jgi:hypothetical protein
MDALLATGADGTPETLLVGSNVAESVVLELDAESVGPATQPRREAVWVRDYALLDVKAPK